MPRRSKRARVRAAVLIGVHLLIAVHIAHWMIAGRTLTPLEPSEAMQTLEQGLVNAGFLVFAVLILSTLVLGRFFCGWACHVVAYQDAAAWLLAKLKIRPRLVRSRLLLFVPLAIAIYMFVWPSVKRWWNGGALPEPAWHLTTADFWQTFPGVSIALLTFFVDGFLLVYFLGAKGFCTYGCPYGAIFGAADRVAPGRIRVTDACNGCGHCTSVCTSNVQVHVEVKTHATVVNPGCMKCMDCVSVCPKDALYYGFGAPALLTKGRARARKIYDFTWPEEIAMAVAFLAGFFAFRGLYDLVPLLLAVGLAVLTAVATIVLARLASKPMFRWQHVTLKDRSLRRRGWIACGVATVWLSLVAHSAFVQYHAWRGERQFEELRDRSSVSNEALESALYHMETARDVGFVAVASHEFRVAAIQVRMGRLPQAEASYRRILELREDDRNARFRLAQVLAMQRKPEAEEHLRRLIEEHAGWPEPRYRIAQLLHRRGRVEEARTHLLRGRELAPGDGRFDLFLKRLGPIQE